MIERNHRISLERMECGGFLFRGKAEKDLIVAAGLASSKSAIGPKGAWRSASCATPDKKSSTRAPAARRKGALIVTCRPYSLG